MTNEQVLENARHQIGLYTIEELRAMFKDSITEKKLGRYSIDNALNSGELKYISPNNKKRFVYIQDFLAFMEKAHER